MIGHYLDHVEVPIGQALQVSTNNLVLEAKDLGDHFDSPQVQFMPEPEVHTFTISLYCFHVSDVVRLNFVCVCDNGNFLQ